MFYGLLCDLKLGGQKVTVKNHGLDPLEKRKLQETRRHVLSPHPRELQKKRGAAPLENSITEQRPSTK